MTYPKIRIYDSFLLNNDIIPLLLPRLRAEGREAEATKEFIKEKVADYNDSWKPYEERIIAGMCTALGLEFSQNIIDVYIAPLHHAFSDPMVVSTKYSADRFVDVLTHEILHRLLTDNTTVSKEWTGLLEMWRELFGGDHEWDTLVHIPVHLVMKYVFVDVLHEPRRLERDISLTQKYELYKKAWDYVEANDYRALIDKLRRAYASL